MFCRNYPAVVKHSAMQSVVCMQSKLCCTEGLAAVHAQLNRLAELEAPAVLFCRTALLELAPIKRSKCIEDPASLQAQHNRLVV